MTDAITPLLISITIPLLFWWLARQYPAPELTQDGPSLEELAPRFRKWEFALVVVYMALWAPVAAALATPLRWLAEWRARSMQVETQTFVFYMEDAAWWLPAFFMALLLSGLLLTPLLKAVLKQSYRDYERYNALRYGFDQRRVLKGLAVLVCTGCALLTYVFFDAYVVASPRELRVNTLFGPERRYEYTQITEIVTAPALVAPNGNTVYRRIFLIRFADGSSYSTDNMPQQELGERSRTQWIEFILSQSGLSPREKPVFQRGEL